MQTIVLHELRIQRDAFEQKRQQRRLELRAQVPIHGTQPVAITRAVVDRDLDADQQHFRTGCLAQLDDVFEVSACYFQLQAAQCVVGTEFDDDQCRMMFGEQRRQARQTFVGRLTTDAGVDHGARKVRVLFETRVEQRYPAGFRCDAIRRRKRIAEYENWRGDQGKSVQRQDQQTEKK